MYILRPWQRQQLPDEAAAERIEAAAEAVGIGVADQLILGHGALYSLRSRRVLLFPTPDLVTDMTLAEYAAL